MKLFKMHLFLCILLFIAESGISMNVRSHFASHHDGKVGCRRLNFGNGGRQSTTTSTTQQP